MTGTCKFCGQIVEVGLDTLDPDGVAHEYCDCREAQHERRIQTQIDEAWENIDALFGPGCEELGFAPLREAAPVEILKQLAAEVARDHIASASLVIFGGGKATVKAGSRGEVKVTQQIVRAQTMEAGLFH